MYTRLSSAGTNINSLSSPVADCDASQAPSHGGVGNCTSSLPSGSICLPSCNTGYKLLRESSCSAGVLSAAICAPPAPPGARKDQDLRTSYVCCHCECEDQGHDVVVSAISVIRMYYLCVSISNLHSKYAYAHTQLRIIVRMA